MILNPGNTLKHPCGLVYRNVTRKAIEFAKGECPQCHVPIAAVHISGGPSEMVTWTLHPPPGMAFKNSMGSEVTVSCPRGQEADLFQALQHQINSYFRASLPGGGGVVQGQARAVRGPIRLPKMTVNDDGEIIVSDEEDAVGSAAANVMRNTGQSRGALPPPPAVGLNERGISNPQYPQANGPDHFDTEDSNKE